MNEPPIIDRPAAERITQGHAGRSLLDNRWVVLGAIFLAMMFLGLPLLWKSKAFSRAEKIVWSIITLLYSAALIWLFIRVMMWSWQNISHSF